MTERWLRAIFSKAIATGQTIGACRVSPSHFHQLPRWVLGEAEARAAGLKFRINREKVPDWYTARRVAETVYGFKTLVEKGTGRMLMK